MVSKTCLRKEAMISAKNKLQITIITFNRKKYLQRTLEIFLSDTSPVRDYDIMILDNCSNDDTYSVVKHFQKQHKNITYKKNNYNVGANANIAKAFEYNTKDYLWIVADDDTYDWSNWSEVEQAILANEKAIIVSRMDLPEKFKYNISKQLTQSAFVSAVIYSKDLLNDTVIKTIYDNVYCMFPHIIPLVNFINNHGTLYVVDKQIVKHGVYENKTAEDVSWLRGYDKKFCSSRFVNMTFEGGFAIAISDLNDTNLKYQTMDILIEYIDWRNGKRDIDSVIKQYINLSFIHNNFYNIMDFYCNMRTKYKKIIIKYLLAFYLKFSLIKFKVKCLKLLLKISSTKYKEKFDCKLKKYYNKYHIS